jgi:DNA-binding SARP family transcriptional activator
VPPALPRVHVARPRLQRLLAELIEEYPVVWLCASAGAGKTTAVLEHLASTRVPVAWLAVDRTDAAPGRLLTYLEAALERQVPAVAGVATEALSVGIAHPEAAGLLAEAVGESSLVLVIDDLERLAEAAESLEVISALIRYAAPAMRVVLISRREIGLDLGSTASLPRVAAVEEGDLAFTADEATEALRQAGSEGLEAESALEATGGWVAGVLFEAWRSRDHIAGIGGEADPLHGYLGSQILDQLPPEEREFLISVSVLDHVTAARAEALGIEDAGARLAALRARRLPVTWEASGRSLRCHPRFREYLRSRLDEWDAPRARELRRRSALLFAREGHHEEAVEELLALGLVEEAQPSVERAIGTLIDRLDLAAADRWLDAYEGLPARGSNAFLRAEILLAISTDNYARGAEIGDRLTREDRLESFARESGRVTSLLAWTYFHVGRIPDGRLILDIAPPGPDVEVLRYMFSLVDDDDAPVVSPALTGGQLDALITRVHYAHGFLRQLDREPLSRWAAAMYTPWRAAALRALGQPQEALEVCRQTRSLRRDLGVRAVIEAEILGDLGLGEEAHEVVRRGREHVSASGSVVLHLYMETIAAKVLLRVDGDAAAGLAGLERLERSAPVASYRFMTEQVDTWSGYALLLLDRSGEALDRLRRATRSMQQGDRILELPAAAVYLAEAEWRAEDEDAADRAADLALAAARRQGSDHLLRQALLDFPAVLIRRLDAEPGPDSPWHRLARSLRGSGSSLAALVPPTVYLSDFGEPTLVVDGEEIRPRIRKSLDLLALLTLRPRGQATREELLGALFAGRTDDSTRAYLRQAVNRLRDALPENAALRVDRELVALEDRELVSTASGRCEAMLAEAARIPGPERVDGLLAALRLADAGEYMSGSEAAWIDQRRERLVRATSAARLDAAEVLFGLGRYAEAEALIGATLETEPFSEQAWRLRMRVAASVGDEDGVISAYRRCRIELERLGMTPSPATESVLASARPSKPVTR